MEAQAEKSQISNMPYVTDTALEMRLSVREILFEIEGCLSGKMMQNYYDKEDQTWKIKETTIGKAKANEEGIQAIMGFVKNIINTATVQGNFDELKYGNYVAEKREEFADILSENSSKWGVEDHYLHYIVDMILSFVKPFVSRTIGNLERESYTNTIRTTETSQVSGEQFAK